MGARLELVQVILDGRCRGAAQADEHPCGRGGAGRRPARFLHQGAGGLDPDEAMRRAAHWAGLSFSPAIPTVPDTHVEVVRIDAFAGVRVIRQPQFGREMIYLAPGFDGLAGLKAHVAARPASKAEICVVPAHAIRTALARQSAAQLLDEARQRLSRRWPFASAHLDLGLARAPRLRAGGRRRRGDGGAGAAGDRDRAAAAARPAAGGAGGAAAGARCARRCLPRGRRQWRRTGALPIYSVLVPLRDEAQMVPQARPGIGGAALSAGKARRQIRRGSAQQCDGRGGQAPAGRSALRAGRGAPTPNRAPSRRRSISRCPSCAARMW